MNEIALMIVSDIIDSLPTVEGKAREPNESEWVKMTGMMIPELHGYHMCRQCEWHEDYHNRETLYPYCPCCGAKMKNGVKKDA